MALRGNLRDFSLTRILHLVNMSNKTGQLIIKGESEARIYFREGKLVYAILDGQSSDLTSILRRAGKLSHMQNLPISSQAGDKEAGLMLINAGYMSREDILETLRVHTLETVSQLFSWDEGNFTFEPDVLPPRDRITVPVHLENVILESTRKLRERRMLEEELPNLDLGLKFTADPNAKLKRISLSKDEWQIVSSINPRRSIRQIGQAHSMNDYRIRKIVYGLMSAGLVELLPLEETLPLPPMEKKPAPVRRGILLRLIEAIKSR